MNVYTYSTHDKNHEYEVQVYTTILGTLHELCRVCLIILNIKTVVWTQGPSDTGIPGAFSIHISRISSSRGSSHIVVLKYQWKYVDREYIA